MHPSPCRVIVLVTPAAGGVPVTLIVCDTAPSAVGVKVTEIGCDRPQPSVPATPVHWKGEPAGGGLTLKLIGTSPVLVIVTVLAGGVVPTWIWPKSVGVGVKVKAGTAATALPEHTSLSSPLAGVRVIGMLTLLKLPTAPGAKVTLTVTV